MRPGAVYLATWRRLAVARLSERRELPLGVVRGSEAELAEMGLGRGDENVERDAGPAVVGGVPGVRG